MENDAADVHKNLPRLAPAAYRGLATVHWIFTIKGRKTGWLTDRFFLQFQLVALHTFARYSLASPCICLMPDHVHLLIMGFSESSDQCLAIPFLRTQLKPLLAPLEFQKVPYDHVLRKEERKRNAFATMAGYILANPFRAGLVDNETSDWTYQCSLIPGYPDLPLRTDDYWDRFWKIYYSLVEKHES